MNPSIEPLLLNARDASKALGISDRSLWTLTFGEDIPPEDRVPHVRLGHRVLYDPDDLRAYIKRKKRNGNPGPSC